MPPTTITTKDRPPAIAAMRRLVERVLPGEDAVVKALREKLLAYALNPASGNLLLRGPSGSGKSTVARLVAVLLRIAMSTGEHAETFVDRLRWDGRNLVSLLSLSEWYVEQSLTGLADGIVERQLFGSVRGAFTGALDAPGIFELAGRGVVSGDRTSAAQLTGGVVFLDEVGDLAPQHQAKLLTILSGGSTFRLGGEGDPAHAVSFSGRVVTASWKSLDAGVLRPDLLARLVGTEIVLPGLDERRDDMPAIVAGVVEDTIARIRERIQGALIADTGVDRGWWKDHAETLCCPEGIVERFTKIDWSRHGNMRGLAAAVARAVAPGADLDAILANLPELGLDPGPDQSERANGLFDRLARRPANGDGLGEHLRALAAEDAAAFQERLKLPGAVPRLAEALGLDEAKLRRQASELGRRRRKNPGESA